LTGDSICANDALIFVHGKKQCGSTIVAWQSGDDPCVSKKLAKESFLHRTRGGNGRG
jgi:hypothetical protein